MLQGKVVVFSDSQSVIHLCKNLIYHERTKHVDVKYHYVRDQVANGTVIIKKVPIEDNPADIRMKIVTAAKFNHCLDLLLVRVG